MFRSRIVKFFRFVKIICRQICGPLSADSYSPLFGLFRRSSVRSSVWAKFVNTWLLHCVHRAFYSYGITKGIPIVKPKIVVMNNCVFSILKSNIQFTMWSTLNLDKYIKYTQAHKNIRTFVDAFYEFITYVIRNILEFH